MKTIYLSCIFWLSRYSAICVLLFFSVTMYGQVVSIQGPTPPLIGLPNGFAVDCDLIANWCSENVVENGYDDWIVYGHGGTGLLNALTGVPLDPSCTWHITDLLGNKDLNGFTSGSKFNMDPNLWNWSPGVGPGKDDMQHAVVHLSRAISNNDLWFIMAGDRSFVKGTSYIDFELLQRRLVSTAGGGFESDGPHGGRTLGDICVTVQFDNGGSHPTVWIYRWSQISPDVFAYQELSAGSIPAGTVFAASNNKCSVEVPYEAFSETTYEQFAFAEAAVNVSAIIGELDPCYGISTVMVKTKSSTSVTAMLKDMVDPIQVNITPPPLVIHCPTAVNLTACTDPEDIEDAFEAWTDGFYLDEGGVEPITDNIADPELYPGMSLLPELPADATCGVSLSFTFKVGSLCDTAECTSTFIVQNVTAVSLTIPDDTTIAKCESQPTVNSEFAYWLAEAGFTGGCNGVLTRVPETPSPPSHCGGSVEVTWTVTSDCEDPVIKSATFSVPVAEEVSLTVPDDYTALQCESQSTIDSVFAWWLSEAHCSGECSVNLTRSPENPVAPDHCGGIMEVTWTVTCDCYSTVIKSATFTVTDADELLVDGPVAVALPECTLPADIQISWDLWRSEFTKGGDCNTTDNLGDLPEDAVINPDGSVTLVSFTYIVTGDCSYDEFTSTFSAAPCAPECQTAYGYLNASNSICFINDGFSRWGWTTEIPETEEEVTHSLSLYASASGCDPLNGELAGEVEITRDMENMSVTFSTISGYSLDEVHVYAGCEKYPEKNGIPTVAPGQYNFGVAGLDDVSELTVIFTGTSDDIYVIAHAVVCSRTGSESAGPFGPEEILCNKSGWLEGNTMLEPGALNVYPNPFNDKVYFEFIADTDTRATLEIFTITGQKMVTVLDSHVEKGVFNRIEYTPENAISEMFMYRLTMNGYAKNGIIVFHKQ